MYRFIEKVHIMNPTGRKQKVLLENLYDIKKKVFLIVTISVCGFVAFAGLPIYKLVVDRELIALTTLYIPFLDQNAEKDLTIANVIMTVYGLYGYAGNIAYDLFIAINIMLSSAMVKLIQCDLDDLDQMLIEDVHSTEYRQWYFRNILAKFTDVNKYFNAYSVCLSITTKLPYKTKHNYILPYFWTDNFVVVGKLLNCSVIDFEYFSFIGYLSDFFGGVINLQICAAYVATILALFAVAIVS